MNENLARWVFASVANYFSAIVTGIGIPLLVEGVDEREPGDIREDHAELRVNGPFVRELSKNYWRI